MPDGPSSAVPSYGQTGQLFISSRDTGRGAHVECECGWISARYTSPAEAVAAAMLHDATAHGQGAPSLPGPSQ